MGCGQRCYCNGDKVMGVLKNLGREAEEDQLKALHYLHLLFFSAVYPKRLNCVSPSSLDHFLH